MRPGYGVYTKEACADTVIVLVSLHVCFGMRCPKMAGARAPPPMSTTEYNIRGSNRIHVDAMLSAVLVCNLLPLGIGYSPNYNVV